MSDHKHEHRALLNSRRTSELSDDGIVHERIPSKTTTPKPQMIAGAFCVILILLIAGVSWLANFLLKDAIAAAGTYALGEPTTIQGLSLGLLSDRATITGVDISSPPGFRKEFMHVERAIFDLNLSSLLQSPVEIEELFASGVRIYFEQKLEGKSNAKQLLEHLNDAMPRVVSNTDADGGPARTTGTTERPQGAAADNGPLKLIADRITFTNITIEISALPLSDALGTLAVTIDSIVISNVGRAENGVTLREFVAIVVRAVVAAAFKAGPHVLPPDGQTNSSEILKQVWDFGEDIMENEGDDLVKVVSKWRGQ